MRVLITGGAGFVGSHLAEALLDAATRCSSSTTSRPARSTTSSTSRPTRGSTTPSTSVTNEPLLAELIDRCDVVFHLAAAVGVKLIVEAAGPHHRDQRARHRGRAPARQQEEEAGGHRLDLRGLRQEHRRAVPRGRRPGAGPDHEAPLGLRLQQGDRRVPGARLLEGDEAAGDRRSGCSTPSARARPASTGW